MSPFSNESIFGEAADWNVWDVNVRIGPSSPNGHLGMDARALLDGMSCLYGSDMPALDTAGTLADVFTANVFDDDKEKILRYNFLRES